MNRRWTPDDILSLGRGYQAACVLAAAAELDLFGAIAERPATAALLAAKLGLDARGVAVLGDALAALGLLVKRGTEYSVSADVADSLTETGNRPVLSMVRHQSNCLRRWAQLAHVVRTGRAAERVPSLRGDAADQEAFIGAMDEVSEPLAPALVAKLQPLAFRHLLDLGGASGTWTIAFLRAVPGARATLFDLPEVIPLARRRIAQAGMADRVTFVAGDFYVGALPAGTDFVWCSAIVHQNSRGQNRELFAKVREALVPGGRIVVRDVVMEASRTRPVAGAMFAVNMLVGTPEGSTYTFAELRDDLQASSFAEVALTHQGEQMDSLLCATKPR